MPKTTKKKPMSKADAALKAMENMVLPTAGDLDVHIDQVRERLKAAGFSADFGSIVYTGRMSSGSGHVQVNIGSGGFASTWPEWAFGVAEGRCTLIRRCSSSTMINRPAATCCKCSARTFRFDRSQGTTAWHRTGMASVELSQQPLCFLLR
jgi:hypothetical protein